MAFKRNKQETPPVEEAGKPIGRHAAPDAATTPTPQNPNASVGTIEVDEGTRAEQRARAAAAAAPPERVEALSRGRLGTFLVERGLIGEDQLDQGLAQQAEIGGKIGDVLVQMGFIDDRVLVDALADFLGVPVSNLRRENVDEDALALIPEQMARDTWSCRSASVPTASTSPSRSPPRSSARCSHSTRRHPVRLMLAPLSDIRWAIDTNYRAIVGVDNLVAAFLSVEGQRRRTSTGEADADIESDDAPVVQVVDRLITQAMRDRASDIHIEPADDIVRIRFRIDGALHEIIQLPAMMGPGAREPPQDHGGDEHRRAAPSPGRPDHDDDRRQGRRRPGLDGVDDLGRELRHARPRQDPVGLPARRPRDADRHAHAVLQDRPRALRHGAVRRPDRERARPRRCTRRLSEIDNPTRNVMTIEDPVEYVFPSINQIQTNEQAGLTFATGLKSILRQDPDVILVGEIRDVETARIATQSALTGHFVISSMHATDSVSALHRFLDMGIESFLIASSVLAVVAQRLVRRICPSCKTPYELNDEERMFYEESGGHPEKQVFYHGTGCNFCSGTGFKERIGVYELLQMTPEIKRLIVGWATQEELRNLAKKQGMRTLRQEAINLVAQDVTTVDEVVRSMYTL